MTALAQTPAAARCAGSASSTCRWAATSPRWTPAGEGRIDGAVADAAARWRRSPTSVTVRHQPGAAERVSGHARDLERRVPERGRGEADREHGLLPRHDGRSDRRRSRSAARRSCRRSSWRWTCCQTVGQCDNGYACVYQNNLSWSSPTTPLPAEAHPRVVFERLFGEGGSAGRPAGRAAASGPACSTAVTRGHRAAAEDSSGPADRAARRPVSRHRPRGRAAHPEGRGRRRRTTPLPDLDRPVGVPAVVRRPRAADVRPAGAGPAGRRHARHHVPARARDEQPDLSRDRRLRSAPPADASRQRPGEGREDGEDQRRSTCRCSPTSSRSCRRRRRATARCSITRSTCTAAAWATPTSTTTSNLPILVAGGGAGPMKGGRHIRYAEPTPLANLHLTLLDKVGVRLDAVRRQPGPGRRAARSAVDVTAHERAIGRARCLADGRCGCWRRGRPVRGRGRRAAGRRGRAGGRGRRSAPC